MGGCRGFVRSVHTAETRAENDMRLKLTAPRGKRLGDPTAPEHRAPTEGLLPISDRWRRGYCLAAGALAAGWCTRAADPRCRLARSGGLPWREPLSRKARRWQARRTAPGERVASSASGVSSRYAPPPLRSGPDG